MAKGIKTRSEERKSKESQNGEIEANQSDSLGAPGAQELTVDPTNSKNGSGGKGSNKIQPKINTKYIISRSYEAKEDSEISVEVGDIVLVKSFNPAWAIIDDVKTKKEGSIPINVIGAPIVITGGKATCWMSCNYYIIASLLGCVVAVLGCVVAILGLLFATGPNEPVKTIDMNSLGDELDKMESIFKGQSDDLWVTLHSCLNATLHGKHPCIVLLLNGGNNDMSCFLEEIGVLGAHLLNVNPKDIIRLSGSKLDPKIVTFLHLKSNLTEYKVMTVSEMERIPGELIQMFHSLCDIYSPAVEQAIIIFMLNHSNVLVESQGKNVATLALDLITELWKDAMHHDLINPLAVRLTENSVKVNFIPENTKCKIINT